MTFKKIYIEITNICNMDCSFCSKDIKKKRELKLEEFEHVLRSIKPYTKYICLHIKGEPFMHSKINDILNMCSKYNISVNITTNGTLLEKNIDLIKTNDSIRQINISLHSFEKNGLVEDKYVESIVNSTKIILENTDIIICYRFWTLDDKILKEKNKEMLNEIIGSLNLKLDSEYLNNDKKDIKLTKNLYLSKGKVFEWPSLHNSYFSTSGSCYGLKTHIGILSDGTVVPCCLDSSGIIDLGNIFKESLDVILNKKRVKDILEQFSKNKKIESLCQRCSFNKKR